ASRFASFFTLDGGRDRIATKIGRTSGSSTPVIPRRTKNSSTSDGAAHHFRISSDGVRNPGVLLSSPTTFRDMIERPGGSLSMARSVLPAQSQRMGAAGDYCLSAP